MKVSRSTKSITQIKEDGVKVGDDSKAEYDDKCKFGSGEIGGNKIDGVEIGDDKVVDQKDYQKISLFKKSSKFKKTVESSNFLTLRARLVFTKLRQAFITTAIFHHFDLKRYI